MFESIFGDSTRNHTSMDKAHAMIIASSVMAAKPRFTLELGVGTGTCTGPILEAIRYNMSGMLTCVDLWIDYDGKKPEFVKEYENQGAYLVTKHEREFCLDSETNSYDFLVSDADHGAGWLGEHIRICRPGAIMFFHDTNNPDFHNLYNIQNIVKELGWSHYHFKENSRDDERCHRGLLMVVNGK